MARKLKVFQTSLGFFDQAIAAPSMKAALEAWGADSNLFHQGAAMNWLPVSREKSWPLRPNNFLIARTLETLCEAAYLEYNFGASPHGAEGLIRFKESWGATPRPLVIAGRRSSVHRKLRG